MKPAEPYNILVTGIGGQGVVTLTETLWKVCELQNWQCQGSIFKGGAQQHGSVTAFVRIFFQANPHYQNYSPQVPEGALDLMLGMEPWEALRQNRFFGEKTRLIVNTQATPLLVERFEGRSDRNPVNELENTRIPGVFLDFTELAIQKYQEPKMATFLLVDEGIRAGHIPIKRDVFLRAYLERVRLRSDLSQKLKGEIYGNVLEN